MSESFHQQFEDEKIKAPPARSTGLVFAAVCAIIAVIWRDTSAVLSGFAVLSALFLATSLIAPKLLEPLNRVWFRFSLFLGKVVTPVVMFIIFAVVFVPAGALMRLKSDPLNRKRRDTNGTFWVNRDKDLDATGSMKNQF